MFAQLYARGESTITKQQCAQLFDDILNMAGTGSRHAALSSQLFASFLDYAGSLQAMTVLSTERRNSTGTIDTSCTSPVSVTAELQSPPSIARRITLSIHIPPLKLSRKRFGTQPDATEETFPIDVFVRFCKLHRAQLWPVRTVQSELRSHYIGASYWETLVKTVKIQQLREQASLESTDLFSLLEDTQDLRKSRTSPRSSPLNRIFTRLGGATRALIK